MERTKKYHMSQSFRLLFVPEVVNMRYRAEEGPLVFSCQNLQQPSSPAKRFWQTHEPFRCGKQAAYRLCGAATTTAGRKPTRQCFAEGSPLERLASNGVRFFRRIVKKLTKPQGSNRPERRLPESDGDRPGVVALETTVSVSFAQDSLPKVL